MTDAGPFKLCAPFEPTGDQPAAIATLCAGLDAGRALPGPGGRDRVRQDVHDGQRDRAHWAGRRWSISHNKTLAAQLYAELKAFFPDNAVEYFVSYYDYYQPEAYIPQTDTYIEKDASINEEIERLRLSATNSLLCREDVIIVASVSCIYGLGSPEDYAGMLVRAASGAKQSTATRCCASWWTSSTRATTTSPSRARSACAATRVDIFPSYCQDGRADGVLRRRGRGDSARSIALTGNAEARAGSRR